jgi:hypothetical protein
MNTQCITIRTHYINDDILSTYEIISKIFGEENTFITLDATKNNVLKQPPKNVKVINISLQVLKTLDLPYFEKWGWQCGDYFLYATQLNVTYDYYWMIEPDVNFQINDFKQVISDTSSLEFDFLAVGHGKRSADWYWSKTFDSQTQVYGCHFPLVRASNSALVFLLRKRVEIGQKIKFNPNSINWSNDEGFISTTLEENNFTCSDLREHSNVTFENFTTTIPLLKTKEPPKGISHPALPWGEYKEKCPTRIANYYRSGGNQRNFLQKSLNGLNQDQIIEIIDLSMKKLVEH